LTAKVVLGQKTVITCTAKGFPTPFINWRHNWGHVCDEPRCKIENFRNGTGTFTIYQVEPNDNGAYSCEAINSKGRVFGSNDIHISIKSDEIS
jgi:heparan sulfate proteoglycan 2 (perlecan)